MAWTAHSFFSCNLGRHGHGKHHAFASSHGHCHAGQVLAPLHLPHRFAAVTLVSCPLLCIFTRAPDSLRTHTCIRNRRGQWKAATMLESFADAFVCSPAHFSECVVESETARRSVLAHCCSLWAPTSANDTCCKLQSSIADSAPIQALIEALAANGNCSLYMPSSALHLRQAQRFAHLCCTERSFLHSACKCFLLLYLEQNFTAAILCQRRPDRIAGVFIIHHLQY